MRQPHRRSTDLLRPQHNRAVVVIIIFINVPSHHYLQHYKKHLYDTYAYNDAHLPWELNGVCPEGFV